MASFVIAEAHDVFTGVLISVLYYNFVQAVLILMVRFFVTCWIPNTGFPTLGIKAGAFLCIGVSGREGSPWEQCSCVRGVGV